MTLLGIYTCNELNRRVNCVEETEMHALAISEFPKIVFEADKYAQALRLSGAAAISTISPLICDCYYQAAASAAWYYKENGSEQMAHCLKQLTDLLLSIKKRWLVAGTY